MGVPSFPPGWDIGMIYWGSTNQCKLSWFWTSIVSRFQTPERKEHVVFAGTDTSAQHD